MKTKKKTVDRTQGVAHVLPYASPRDCPLRQPCRSGTVRAALDGLPPLRSPPQCYGPGSYNEANGSIPTICEESACASVPSARRATQDRLKDKRRKRKPERALLQTELRSEPWSAQDASPLFPLSNLHFVGELLRSNDVMIMV